MSDETCVLGAFSDPIEANLVVHRLRDEGISARVSSDTSGGLFGMGYALGGFDVLVLESDLERAQRVVDKIMAEHEQPWERDDSPIDELPVTVDPDDEELGQSIQAAHGTDNRPRRLVDAPPADSEPPMLEAAAQPEAPESVVPATAAGDRIVNRAFRAAVFAWFLGPLMPLANVYSILLLFQTGSDSPLTDSGTVKYYVALFIDVIVIGIALILFISFGWIGSRWHHF